MEGKFMLKYKTNYIIKDCISILKNKNIYDVFEYKFDLIDGEDKFKIIFTNCNNHMCRSIRTSYLMKFIQEDNYTIIELSFLNELYVLPIPCIPETWINEFMEQKLDALRV